VKQWIALSKEVFGCMPKGLRINRLHADETDADDKKKKKKNP